MKRTIIGLMVLAAFAIAAGSASGSGFNGQGGRDNQTSLAGSMTAYGDHDYRDHNHNDTSNRQGHGDHRDHRDNHDHRRGGGC
ncbi:MAG: hypothetical protein ACQETG_02960 [Thermodesulfobacteriota bacterium]